MIESSDETHLGDWLSGTIFPLGGDLDRETEVDKTTVYNGNVLSVEREDAKTDATWTYAVDSALHRTGSDWYDGFAHTTWQRSTHVTQNLSDGKVVRSSSDERKPFQTVGWAASVHDPDGDPIYVLHQPESITITDADGRTSVTIIPLPGANSPGVHNTGDNSWLGDVLEGAANGLKAGWYTVVDAYTPDFLVDVSEAKAAAWKQAGLEDTWTQTATEFSASASREASIALATGGLGNLAKASRAAALVMVPVRTALVAREGYEAYQNTVAAYQNFKDENYWASAGRAGLAALNLIGGVGGARQLKSDVKLAFPKTVLPNTKCFPAGTLVSTERGFECIETLEVGRKFWAFELHTGQWRLCPVLETYAFEYTDDLVEIAVAGETLLSTIGHPFWVIEGDDLDLRPTSANIARIMEANTAVPGRWIDSHDLRVGDMLLLKSGKPARITSVGRQPSPGVVYNFAVDELHCYAVGLNQVLVHNDCNFIPLEAVQEAARTGTTATSALTDATRTTLRDLARDIWHSVTGRRAIWDGLQVHHRIPLEWAHLFPSLNPNRESNLFGIATKKHTLVTNAWNAWRRSLNGRIPTQEEVLQQAVQLDEQFGHLMKALP